MNQKGFSLIFIILGLILVIGIASGAYYLGILKNLKPQNPQDTNQTSQPNPSPSDEIANWKTYFKFTDQKSTKITDDSSAKDLVLNFYKAFEKEDGSTLFSYMTPPVTPQEKGEYSYLTGADLDPNAFYRAFLRVKLKNPSIKSLQRVDDKTFEVTATDEFLDYSQVTTQWSQPTLRNVKFTVTKTTASWSIDKFTYTGAISWTYKGTEKYNGFPNLDSN